MPVVRERSSSPPESNLQRAGYDDDHAGPSISKPKYTVNDVQRYKRSGVLTRQLEKMMANPDKEVVTIPEKPLPLWQRQRSEKQIISNNAIASAAAAGSGEFHVYKHGRRREYERIKYLEATTRELEEQAAFKARQEARDAEADAKTAKNRAKRQKRKAGRKGGGGGDDGAKVAAPLPGGGLKRKLEGGAVNFKRPGEESDGDSDGEGGKEAGPTLSIPIPSASAPVEESKVAKESEILIHDDE